VAHDGALHVPHPPPEAPRPFERSPPAVAQVESFLWTFLLPQWGHRGRRRSVIERKSSSNGLEQSSQANS
jgi:hypothetical protein